MLHLGLVSGASGFQGTEKPGPGNWLMKAACCRRGREGLQRKGRGLNGKQMPWKSLVQTPLPSFMAISIPQTPVGTWPWLGMGCA